jgi:hypothetical protein
MQASNRTRNIVSTLVILLAAAALLGATVWTPAKNIPMATPVTKLEAAPSTAGTFTGEYENGVPVYRLPSIAVTTSRSAELAKMAQEAQIARR